MDLCESPNAVNSVFCSILNHIADECGQVPYVFICSLTALAIFCYFYADRYRIDYGPFQFGKKCISPNNIAASHHNRRRDKFILSFLVAFVALIIFDIPLTSSLIALPLVILIQFIFTLGFVCILSAINVYLRDIEHLWSNLVMAWFYLTPIVYPLDMVPAKFMSIFFLNPMAAFTLAYRDILYRGIYPNFTLLGNLLILSVLILAFGYLVYKRLERGFAEVV